MGKKNRNSKSPHGAPPAFPKFADSRQALAWWCGKLRVGFPAPGAAEHLAALADTAGDETLRQKFEVLARIAGRVVQQAGRLSDVPGALSAFSAEPETGRLFIASATGGITCIERNSGKSLWKIETERAFQVGGLASFEGTLFYTDSWRDRLYAVCCQTGRQRWSVDKATNDTPLLCPAGITLARRNGDHHLLLCDSGNHRVCSFSLDGDPLSTWGRRGLEREQIAHIHSAPEGTAVPPYFEYPSGITVVGEPDGEKTVFVWDSGNGRLVLLDSELTPVHTVRIVPGGEIIPRLAGQVSALEGPSGAVIVVIDDAQRTLSVRGPCGETLLSIDLTRLMKSPWRKLELFRLDCGGCADDGILLLSSSGGVWRIPLETLDTARLSTDLLKLFPEESRMVLGHSLLANGELGSTWREISPVLDHNALVRDLFRDCDLLSDEFSLTVGRLEALVDSLRGQSMDDDASALEQALLVQLEELRTATLDRLLRLSRPSPGEVERWSDAHAEVDMEFFQSRGRKSSAELTRDDDLEQVRELRPSIRRQAWQLRRVHRRLASRRGSGWVAGIAVGLLDELEANLDKRVDVIAVAAAALEYERDPQRVAREEIQAAHTAALSVSTLEGAAVELAAEFVRLTRELPETLDSGMTEKVKTLIGKAGGLECREILRDAAGGPPDQTATGGKLQHSPLFEQGISAQLRVLVENMVSYLAKVQNGGSSGGRFGRVLGRQRNLFALKASVLSNFRRPGEDCLAALEQARTMAGDAWQANRQLRLTEPSAEKQQ